MLNNQSFTVTTIDWTISQITKNVFCKENFPADIIQQKALTGSQIFLNALIHKICDWFPKKDILMIISRL